MKQWLCIFVLILLSFNQYNCINSQLKFSSALKLNSSGSEVAWEGWIKYFHYDKEVPITKPSEFFVNNQFFSQKLLKSELNSKGDDGRFKNIIDKNMFYALVLTDKLVLLSKRNDLISSTFETLTFDLISPYDTNDIKNSSIRDIGVFNEGSCISLTTLIPKRFSKDYLAIKKDATNSVENWILCTQLKEEKEKLLSNLVTLKLSNQKLNNISIAATKNLASNTMQSKTTDKIERYTGPNAKPELDGYLILINDWSGCTLKCGGGESFQQWRCIPPKKGGRPCTGELIRKRSCNNNKCPQVSLIDNNSSNSSGNGNDKNGNEELDIKPIFKSLPFFDRPRQNIDCVIKEDDILFETKDDESGLMIKRPGRLLMNEKSVSVFESSDYKTSAFSFNLISTQIESIKEEYCCLFLRSQNKKFKVCSLSDCGTIADPKFVNGWKYSLSLFKTKCFKTTNSDLVAVDGKTDSQKDSQDQVSSESAIATMNIEDDEIEEREKLIKQKLDSEKAASLETRIESSQQVALKAINREINLEEKLKREEMLKAREETRELMTKMNHEKIKKEKLEEAIESKENDNVVVKSEHQAVQSISNINNETQKLIEERRIALKKKITQIRKTSERKKKMIENKIKIIRGKMAQELVVASKVGNQEICTSSIGKKSKIEEYCNQNYINDFSKNQDCKYAETFCYSCCDSEFGASQQDKRDQCYSACDSLNNK